MINQPILLGGSAMPILTLRRIACIAIAILAAACGSEYKAPEVTSDGPHLFSGDSGAGSGDTGAGGASSYLSEFRTATERALLRKRLAARTFSIPEDQVDARVNYNYNDWGQGYWVQGHDCDMGGYLGGHSGIDYQTKSVEGTATVDVPIYSISAGTFVTFRTHVWGITAIVRSRVPGQDQDVYFHYLHLRSANQNLRPGDAVSTSTDLGIQGSFDPKTPNKSEHVHLEVSLNDFKDGSGANPNLCGHSTGATLDPYPILAGLFDSGSPSGTNSPTVDANGQPSLDSGGGGGSVLAQPIAGSLAVAKEGGFFDVNYNNGVTRYVNGADQWRQHLGTDFKAAPNTNVVSISAGTAIYCSTTLNDPFNSAVIVQQPDGVQVVYGHIYSNLTKNTATGNCGSVEQNQSLGYVQPTNSSSASYVPHVHMGYNTKSLALPVILGNFEWGWGRAPFSTTHAEAENRGWVDINTFYNAPMQQ